MEANETTEAITATRRNSPLEVSSRIISGIFTPFMIPFVAFFLLFFFTYLRIMPIQYKLIVLGIVYFHHSDADARHLPVSKNKRLGHS